ncbi:metal tolerance protein 9-like [Arachis stenosperma]|uniref:metal tolerance protein 9-like n=1 Tax=Arachis stenosperma TaxID=217475 RepID=UPI0025AC9DA1|nr:metal tolerance protein 9-like [Arachis stenosperma]
MEGENNNKKKKNGSSSSSEECSNYRMELLSPEATAENVSMARQPSWRINMDQYRLPQRNIIDSRFGLSLLLALRRQKKLAEYYKRQERLLKGYQEVDSFTDLGILPSQMTKEEMKEVERSERAAIYASNIGNMVLFGAKVYASVESMSLAVIASTLDSLLDLLSGFILWFTSYSMSKPNHHKYPIGKNRMQPVGIVVFASVMATLGLQILFESIRQIITKTQPERDPVKEKWMIGIMVAASLVKLLLMTYCQRFKNEIIRAYAQDHFFDVITNSIGLAAAVLAIKFYWWIDPLGAILIAIYTISNWAKTVMENVWSLIGRTAPPEYIAKLTYLCWNHDKEIKHIDTMRAYRYGSNYFVEVDIVVSEDMSLIQAHDIGESLQEKLEKLPEIERAFVHIDLNTTHKLEHNPKVV